METECFYATHKVYFRLETSVLYWFLKMFEKFVQTCVILGNCLAYLKSWVGDSSVLVSRPTASTTVWLEFLPQKASLDYEGFSLKSLIFNVLLAALFSRKPVLWDFQTEAQKKQIINEVN